MLNATEAAQLKYRATSGAAAQSGDATAGSPLLHSLIDRSVVLSIHSRSIILKNCSEDRLDDLPS